MLCEALQSDSCASAIPLCSCQGQQGKRKPQPIPVGHRETPFSSGELLSPVRQEGQTIIILSSAGKAPALQSLLLGQSPASACGAGAG